MRKNIADIIKTRRLLLGMTQSELARLSGVSKQVINNWERMNEEPKACNFLKVCKVLGLGINDFID